MEGCVSGFGSVFASYPDIQSYTEIKLSFYNSLIQFRELSVNKSKNLQ